MKRAGDDANPSTKRAKQGLNNVGKISNSSDLSPGPSQSYPPLASNNEQHNLIDDDTDEDNIVLPNDALVAIKFLNAQFPKQLKDSGVPPFILKTQLYCVLKDRTVADRELDQLRHSNAVRVFKLSSGSEDYAIMVTSDYEAAVDTCKQSAEAAATPPALLRTFEWYCTRVLPCYTDVVITEVKLKELLSKNESSDTSQPDRITPAHIGLLLRHCLLTRHVSTGPNSSNTGESFIFSMPGAGPALRGIEAGRRELLGALRRRKHPEMLETELNKRALRGSKLGIQWHVRDLLGSGSVIKLETTVGSLIRIAQRG